MPEIWRSKLLSQFGEIHHGSAGRGFGMRRFSAISKEEANAMNESFVHRQVSSDCQAICVEQIHSEDVINLGAEELQHLKKERQTVCGVGDGLITNQSKAALLIRTADCVPLILYAPKSRVIGAAHAGWKGTSKKIVQELISLMKNEYNVDPSALFVAIGPAIGVCHYDVSQVKDNRAELFENLFDTDANVLVRDAHKVALDLKEANRQWCLQAGVPASHIEVSDVCTFEQSVDWPSYRKDGEGLNELISTFVVLV